MARYFLALAYRGTAYSGFQVQENAHTVQAEVEKAFSVLHRRPVTLTGSSRTDAGVHAEENYFHFDDEEEVHPQFIYKMNALLPDDVVVRQLYRMPDTAHARFDALSREYVYKIHRFKNPFLKGLSCYYPYQLDFALMQQAAGLVMGTQNFFAFSKTNTQVRHFQCTILKSQWQQEGEIWYYTIEGTRFLRGMVRLLTATMLRLGRGMISLQEFENYFREERKCGFSVPAQGLYLKRVRYPENFFPATGGGFTGF